MNIGDYSARWQQTILVLFVIHKLARPCTRAEVLELVDLKRYYDIQLEDLETVGSEPRFRNQLAWARKDALECGWLDGNGIKNWWALSKRGKEYLESVLRAFLSRQLDISRCYLWTPKFKKLLDPSYEPSPRDAKRPRQIAQSVFV